MLFSKTYKLEIMAALERRTGVQGPSLRTPDVGGHVEQRELPFKGKVALITGISNRKGIGIATARRLIQDGIGAVAFTSRPESEEKALGIADELTEMGTQAHWIGADFSDISAARSVIGSIRDQFGRLDIVVNNAGMTEGVTPYHELTPEQLQQLITVDLLVPIMLVRYALQDERKRLLPKQGGRIINIASIVGIYGNTGQEAYGAAKAGLIGFTKSAAVDLARIGTTVNTIAPGFLVTDLTQNIANNSLASKIIKSETPMGGFVPTDAIAHAVAFFAHPNSQFITGQVLEVDGGLGGAYNANPGLRKAGFFRDK